ncbi:MAG: SnoaL-like domain-containing protein, partial [Clostridiales bacterium]|nr:SnoaL-like domain-containing protein [Clostridiales bacterium]
MYPGLKPEQQLQCLVDIKEIENVMAKHEYFLSQGKTELELETIWARETEGAHFAQNQGYYVGYDSIMNYYGKLTDKMNAVNLRALAAHYPDIEVKPENFGMGNLISHPLTTQIIEVAGDGKTAKATWI